MFSDHFLCLSISNLTATVTRNASTTFISRVVIPKLLILQKQNLAELGWYMCLALPLHPYHPTNTRSIVVSEVFLIILCLLFFLSLLRLSATRRSYRAKLLTFGTVLNSPFTDIVWLADWEIQKDVREYSRKCRRSWHFVIDMVVENCRITVLSLWGTMQQIKVLQ